MILTEDDSVCNSTSCFHRGHRFCTQHPHDSSKPSVTSVAEDQIFSSNFLGYLGTHMLYIHLFKFKKFTQKNISLKNYTD